MTFDGVSRQALFLRLGPILVLLALSIFRSPAIGQGAPDKYAGAGRFRDASRALENRLRANPKDSGALRELHSLLATPNDLPREESMRLREIVRAHAQDAKAVLVPSGEPGDPIVVSGTVRDSRGLPVEGAVVTIFHTDAKGLYSPRDAVTMRMDEPNSRIFGFLRTGPNGRYEFRTVRPGGYPLPLPGRSGDQAFVPQHIHLLVSAPGYQIHHCGGATCQLVFTDDPRMTPHWREWARRQGNPVLTLRHAAGGVLGAAYDITLRKEGGP